MKRKHPRTVANLERLRQMLTDLADTNGILRGWAYWKLANEFNKRYASQTKSMNASTMGSYIRQAKEAGWLSTKQEAEDAGMMTFVLLPHMHDASVTPHVSHT